MEIFLELLLTALLSLLSALCLAKLLSFASSSADHDRNSSLPEKSQARVSTPELQRSEVDSEDQEPESVEDRDSGKEVGRDVCRVRELTEIVELSRLDVEADKDEQKKGDVVEKLVFERSEEAAGDEEEYRKEVKNVEFEEDSGGSSSGVENFDVELDKDGFCDSKVVRSDSHVVVEGGLEKATLSGNARCEEEIESNEVEKNIRDEKGIFLSEEDDWEGIERSELENRFGFVARLVTSEGSDMLSNVGNDMQMKLYGLHKVATEGPCYEPQPSMLKASARVKWNAWHELGNMNPELAMEQYIHLLSESVPGWEEHKFELEDKKLEKRNDFADAVAGKESPDLSSSLDHRRSLENEREPGEVHSSALADGGRAPVDRPILIEEGS